MKHQGGLPGWAGKILLILALVGMGFFYWQNIYAEDLININTATLEELDTLPGVGPSKAQAIIDYREQNGPFQTIEDIINVSGIGSVTFEEIKDRITIGEMPEPQEHYCGDGSLDEGEECDDGNNIDNDGCSADCFIEEEEELEEIIGEPSPADIIIHKLGDLVINEFVSDPSDEDVEWIELYNTTNETIDLNGWTIEEGSGAKTNLEDFIGVSGSGKFFVIEKPKGNLNNKGDIIILRDNSNTLIDQATYGNWDDGNISNNAPVISDPNSIARKFDGQNSFNNASDFAITTTLTKGQSNVITRLEEEEFEEISAEERAKYDYSNDIIISEIFPNPEGSDSENEFIELYNRGEREVNLLGWRLGDESKKRYEIAKLSEFKTNGTNANIKPEKYLVIYRSESKIALNNGSDSVKLFQPLRDEPLQAVEYEKSTEGWSYNLVIPADKELSSGYPELSSLEWAWSETVTPSKVNVVKTINHSPIVDFDCPEEVLIGNSVFFDSSDTIDEDNDVLTYFWDFGDTATNTLPCPEHTFFQQGAFTVKLLVSDGENEVEKEKIIKVVKILGEEVVVASEFFVLQDKIQIDSSGGKVIINEFLPNPEGSDAEGEWVELKNTGDTKVNLLNWKLDDIEGGSKPYVFSNDLWLDINKFFVVDRVNCGLALNNSTDVVRLFNDFDELIEEIEYEAVVEGESYARGQNDKWFWTTALTPGEENIISVADSESVIQAVESIGQSKTAKEKIVIETTIEKIKDLEVGDLIKITGIVAVLPGILGAQYFYIVTAPSFILDLPEDLLRAGTEEKNSSNKKVASISFIPSSMTQIMLAQNENNIATNSEQTLTPNSTELTEVDPSSSEEEGTLVSSAGIQVYSYKKDFPDLKVGDYIEVQGELSISSGELRLKTKTSDDFKIIEHGEPPIANELTCEKVSEECVGQLISVTGEVVERKSSIVYLDDGTDEILIYIKTATGINATNIKEGEIITVTGLLGRTQSGIRIMPRSIDDIIKKDPQSHIDTVGQVLGEVAVSDEWEIAKRDKKLEFFQYLLVIAGVTIVVLAGLLVKEIKKKHGNA